MGKSKKTGLKGLTKKQFDFFEELFETDMQYSEIIKKHKVSRRVYRKWLGDKNFINEAAFRVESAKRQSEMIMARNAPKAAEKIIALSGSGKGETSRKACLDIMSHQGAISTTKVKCESTGESISSEAAEKLLAAMARQKRGKNV